MTHKFNNYNEFRNINAEVEISNGKKATIKAVNADPFSIAAMQYGIEWGIEMLIGSTYYYKWMNKGGQPVDECNSILQGKMVDAALLRFKANA